jgi:CHAT domain-containing protein
VLFLSSEAHCSTVIPPEQDPQRTTSILRSSIDATLALDRAVPRVRIRSPRVSGIALCCALAACHSGSAAPGDAFGLAAALESVPGIAPRLSIASSFRPCTEQAPPHGSVVSADCPPHRPSQKPFTALIRAIGTRDDPAAVHARAIMDVVVRDERGIALDRGIASLRQLGGIIDRPAPVLADLAAALIVRAERTQAPRDLLEAYEIAEQALRREPRNLAALYNRALASDRFGLVDESVRDWQAYLAADSTSACAEDARRRMRALLAIRPPVRPTQDAPLTAFRQYAAADPQGARELGMDHFLGKWGEAVEAGDSSRARHMLDRAAELGHVLAERPGGDASLADAVHAIHSSAVNAAATRELASAHRDFTVGRKAFDTPDFPKAETKLAAAAASAGASPALQEWARLHHATALIQLGRLAEGEPILTQVTMAGSRRYPSLAARAGWVLGRILQQRERWEQGLEQGLASARLSHTAGERENEGAALAVVAESQFLLGEADSAYATLHQTLNRLRPFRASVRLHNLLLSSADAVAGDGLLQAAIHLQDEGVKIARRTGQPLVTFEATVSRARLLASAGAMQLARTDVDSARTLIRKVTDRNAQGWMQADLRRAEAVAMPVDEPHRLTLALDSAAAFYTGISLPLLALPALVGAADARLKAGDADGAVRRLESAVHLLDQRRNLIRIEPRRAAVFDAARDVVDRLVLLKLAEGRVAEALDYMDQARASLAPAGASGRGMDAGVQAPTAEIALEYARVADTLLVWTVTAAHVEVSRTVLDTTRFLRTLNILEERLQDGAGEAEVKPALSSLYDWFVRPVEGRLGGTETPVVIIADGEIAAIPFPALYDARRSRYMVQDRPLRFAASLREARRRPAGPSTGGVALVADPAFAPREHPLLEPLPHTRAEVAAIASNYTRPTVLQGAAATRAAMESALARSAIVHFAGHAVFDDQRPERSHLVLAPLAGGRVEAGRISAAELADLDLRHVRLVVLSACRTVRGGKSRAGGFSGLSGALLAAGAGGSVGSTWDVDDQSTAVLMAEFHRALSNNSSGPAALRIAQLALLRSGDLTLRSPAAWGAFRYAGR